MADITSQNAALAIPKIVGTQALDALETKLVMGRLVNRDYDNALQAAGDTVNISIPPTLVANNIAESGSVQTQNPSLGTATVVLNSHIEATFQIPDATRVLTAPDLIKVYMQPAINTIAQRIEADLLGVYPLFTANATTGAGTAMDEARIDLAETEMFNSLVPDGPKFLIVSGSAFSAMRQTGRFTEYQTVGPDVTSAGGSPMLSGSLPGAGPLGANGKVKDFLVFRSQNVPKVSSTYQNLAFSRDAIALVVRALPKPLPNTGAIAEYVSHGNFGLRVTMSYQPGTLAQQFTVDCLYGVGILRQQFGVVVQST